MTNQDKPADAGAVPASSSKNASVKTGVFLFVKPINKAYA